MSTVVAPCISCGVEFESYRSLNRKFCTRECQKSFLKTEKGREYKSSRILETKEKNNTRGIESRVCSRCSTAFTCLKSEKKQFCSKECRYRYLSDNKEEMKVKQRQTNIERYGKESPMKNSLLVEKMKQTTLDRYGEVKNHPRYSIEARLKSVETCLKKYGVPFVPATGKSSNPEKELVAYIKELDQGILIEQNNRVLLRGKELDIYLPDYKLAIEYNGLYFHSESRIKDKQYHINKTKEADQAGIRLIQIFSDEWENRQEVVKEKLKSILHTRTSRPVYGRECEVRELPYSTASTFLDRYHIQGADRAKIRLGLYHSTNLVAVMTFSTGRKPLGGKFEEGVYELSRFATSDQVTGGASKLLTAFIREHTPSRIYSYADRRWSTGNLYEKLGFTRTRVSPPNYWYVDDYRRRYHRYGFRKDILKRELRIEVGTEWETMQQLGYDRVWDCGTIRYDLVIG
jgi:hypothetical protein